MQIKMCYFFISNHCNIFKQVEYTYEHMHFNILFQASLLKKIIIVISGKQLVSDNYFNVNQYIKGAQ